MQESENRVEVERVPRQTPKLYSNITVVNLGAFDVQLDFELIESMPSLDQDDREEGQVEHVRRSSVASLVMSKEYFVKFAELVLKVQQRIVTDSATPTT